MDTGRDVGDVADHFLAGLLGGEVAADEVADVVRLAVLLGERVPPGPRLAGLQAELAHEPADQLGAALLAAADQGLVQPTVAVLGVVGVEQGFYLSI
jgi:hypothetical protein